MSDPGAGAPERYVQLGILDAEGFQRCLERHRVLVQQGQAVPFDRVVLDLGLATPQQVARVRAHLTTARLQCPTCRRCFTVPDFQVNRRYKCQECKAYLEVAIDEATSPALPAAPDAARKDPFEGRSFGAYRVVRRLAKGGMGMVYVGEQASTGARVAIKILTEEASRMPGIQARFKREGTAGARLEHPNIAAILGMGQEGKNAYIVSELVEAGSLEDLVRRQGMLPPDRAVRIACDVLAGLQHAHAHGIAHRDIKPANILIAADGRAKVIDFGLAMDAEAQTILTMAGTVMGTPSFMSPEQAKGERGGSASDLYSCGLVCYFMLTGRRPFDAKNIVQVLKMQVNDPLPSVRAADPGVPEALEKAIEKLTAKEPDRRPRSAADAIVLLRRAMGLEAAPGGAAAPVAAPSWRRSGWPWIGLVAGLLAAAAALAWILLR